MDLESWLLREGDLVQAAGRVVAVDGEVRFEPPLPRHAVGYLPGKRPAPRFSGLGVAVAGADLSELQDRFERDGAVEGTATLEGRWDGQSLQVTDQGPPEWPADTFREWADPPCPTPEGGWPHGRENENLDTPEELVNDPAVVHVLLVRPSVTQVVLTVISTEPDRTRARWSAAYPGRLCVVASRWPRGTVTALSRQAQSRMAEFEAYQAGTGTASDCQPMVAISVVRVLPALVAWAADLPDDLLEVEAWLRPMAAPLG